MIWFYYLAVAGLVVACGGESKDGDSGMDPVDPVTSTGGSATSSGAPTTSTGTTTSSNSTSTTTITSTGVTTSLPIGPADAVAQKGCDLLLASTDNLTAVTSQFDAGQVLIQPSETLAHEIALPATGDGYLSLAVGEWDTTQAFFTLVDNELVTWVPDGMQAGPLQINGACPNDGITDRRIYFEHWTDVVLRYSDVGPRDTWLAVVKE